METDKENTPEGTVNDEAADAAPEQAGDQEEGAEAGPVGAAGSAPGGNFPGGPASGLGAVFGSVLGRAAQFGTVAAAYVYFLGWSFFSNALQRFHVDAEEIGVTPAWLLVRLVPVAIVMVLATGAAYGFISRGRIRSQLTGVAGDGEGEAIVVPALRVGEVVADAQVAALSLGMNVGPRPLERHVVERMPHQALEALVQVQPDLDRRAGQSHVLLVQVGEVLLDLVLHASDRLGADLLAGGGPLEVE